MRYTSEIESPELHDAYPLMALLTISPGCFGEESSFPCQRYFTESSVQILAQRNVHVMTAWHFNGFFVSCVRPKRLEVIHPEYPSSMSYL